MKQLMLLVALVAIMFTACKKDNEKQSSSTNYVKAIAGSFIAKDGNVTLKSGPEIVDPYTPVGVDRTWSVYAKNSAWYGYVSGSDQFNLVDGREFMISSVANKFWSKAGNNPISFGATQAVYSNLTPDEDLRMISESKLQGTGGVIGSGAVAYLGIIDFNPSNQVNFPLTVNCIRLGDVLTINTDQLTHLPGGTHLTFSVTYDYQTINLTLTKSGSISGTNGVPNGTQLQYSDIKYGTTQTTAPIPVNGSGNQIIYHGLDRKVVGNIVVTITDTYTGLVNDQAVGIFTAKYDAGSTVGHGLALTLKTNKIGWLDSQVINFTPDQDITLEGHDVTVN